jgi:hypothetical protein
MDSPLRPASDRHLGFELIDLRLKAADLGGLFVRTLLAFPVVFLALFDSLPLHVHLRRLLSVLDLELDDLFVLVVEPRQDFVAELHRLVERGILPFVGCVLTAFRVVRRSP